jgi:N-acetylmuramic acid 6-phosphate etherase
MNTEKQPEQSLWIDKMPNKEALITMLENQSEVIEAIKLSISDIEKAVSLIVKNLKAFKNSRLIYSGAGTSARIGVQDGVELYPTFGWPKNRVDYIIAGGLRSLTHSVEGAEDNKIDAIEQVSKLQILKGDIVIAVSASGNTPFVYEVIKEAKSCGALTIGISNNFDQKIQKISDLSITLDTGIEILAGSTRLKAGTAQKICLNLMSTLCMARLGNVKNGLMINMVPSNIKLIKRMKLIKSLNNSF